MVQKLTFLLKRRPELTREEFQQTWREDHGPLVRERQDLIGCKRYVQVHTDLDAQPREHGVEIFDGVAELWFDQSLAKGTPEERAQAGRELLEDERRFIDLNASPVWFGEERPVLERDTGDHKLGVGLRRLTYPLRRLPHLSREEFQKYWWETHGPLVRELAPERLRRYVQVHSNPDAEELARGNSRNSPPPYEGVAILWYDDAFPGHPPEVAEQNRPRILGDEEQFIDRNLSPLWWGREIVFIDR